MKVCKALRRQAVRIDLSYASAQLPTNPNSIPSSVSEEPLSRY